MTMLANGGDAAVPKCPQLFHTEPSLGCSGRRRRIAISEPPMGVEPACKEKSVLRYAAAP